MITGGNTLNFNDNSLSDKLSLPYPTHNKPWYGFSLIKGQTDSTVVSVGSDSETIANKPVSSYDRIYPAIVKSDGTINYKLGGATGNDLTRNSDDNVMYDGTEYSCLQAHTSQTGWEPPNVPALWEVV